MTTTDQRMLEALKRALKFEDDGVAYYEKAMEETSDPLALDILKTLRDEEVKHKGRIKRIYDGVSSGGSWVNEDPGAPMPTFENVFERMGGKPASGTFQTEKAAMEHALEIESSGRGMYQNLASDAASDAERQFYERLADEENDHLQIIQDSLEYFEDPQGWFQKHERGTLDGA